MTTRSADSRRSALRTASLVLVALIAVTSAMLAGPLLNSASIGALDQRAPGHGASPAAALARLHPAPPTLAATGKGSFISSYPLPPNLNNTTSVCDAPSSELGSSCGTQNTSFDPSATVLPNGDIAVAYTAIVNSSHCPSNFTFSAIGFTVSTTNGTTWSVPIYLGNTQCDPVNATLYADAWEPALTSLSNGTLVLAYIQFSETNWSYMYGYNEFPELYGSEYYGYPPGEAGNYNWTRVVVTRSFDYGVNWTTPDVLNTSTWDSSIGYPPQNGSAAFVDEYPTIASSGDNVYLAWQNTSLDLYEDFYMYPPVATGASGIQFVSSSDGGATWTNQTEEPVLTTTPSEAWVADNPFLMTIPSGEVFLAYATNASFGEDCFPVGINTYCYYVWTEQPVVGASLTNGTSWNWTYANPQIVSPYSEYPFYYAPEHSSLQPQLAYDGTTGNVILAFIYGSFTTVCYSYGCYPDEVYGPALASSNLSAWNFTARPIDALTAGLNDSGQGPDSSFNNLAIAVTANGTLYVSDTINNESMGWTTPYGYTDYGAQQQQLTWSYDDGQTFVPPLIAPGNEPFDTVMPEGTYSTFVVQGNVASVIWPDVQCPYQLLNSYCYWDMGYSGMNGSTTLTFSQLYTGTGVTVSFNETGLGAGINWSIDLDGNFRGAPAPTNLSVSGVPTGQLLGYSISNYTLPTTRYLPAANVSSPINLTTSINISVDYELQYLVNIESNPYYPQAQAPYNNTANYCYGTISWGMYCPELNYNITGNYGAVWAVNGTHMNTSVALIPDSEYHGYTFSCPTCWFDVYNYSFLSWTGAGTNAITTTGDNISFTVNGPVNETANFAFNAYCEWQPGPPFNESCAPSSQNFSFTESGLPTGATWGVELYGTSGNATTPVTATTNGTSLQVSDPYVGQTVYYLPLTVSGSGSNIWTAQGTPSSPIQVPGDGIVVLHYQSQGTGSGILGSTVMEVGLPAGTSWSWTVNGEGTGTSTELATTTLPLGSDSLGALPVYGSNGVGYYLSEVSILPLVPSDVNANASLDLWQNFTGTSLPASLNVESSLVVVFVFGTQYALTVATSVGGTASLGNGWYGANATVSITANASAGYYFVGWSGAVNSSSPTIRVTMTGPVDELATFQVNPAVRYAVTVNVVGIPANASVVVAFNGSTYSGNSSFVLPTVLAGTYAFNATTVAAVGLSGTQYVPTGTTSTFTSPSNGTYTVASDGTITVTYATQYSLTAVAGADGSVSPSGAWWTNAGSPVTLQATPTAGYEVYGWTGSGLGSVTQAGSGTSISVSPTGPVSETVNFVPIPATVSPTYALTVTETGLPSGTAWSITLNGNGAQGTTASIAVVGLNGSYALGIGAVAAAVSDTEYAPNITSETVTISANHSVAVTFATEFWLSVASGPGGSVTPTANGWYASGASVDLSAVPSLGYVFEQWNGTGSGSYTGATSTGTVTMNGPVTEIASFGQVGQTSTAPASSGSSTAGLPLDLGLLAALLVLGLLVALLLGRRRRESPPPPGEGGIATWDEGTGASPPWSESNEPVTGDPTPVESPPPGAQ
jgi:Divergent InlB B-repeat domain